MTELLKLHRHSPGMFDVPASYCIDTVYVSVGLGRSPSIVCMIVRPVKNVLARSPLKACADYTRPALDGRLLRLAYQVALGPADPCATISRLFAHRSCRRSEQSEKEPGTQHKEDSPVSPPVRDNGVKVFCCALQHHVADEVGRQMRLSGAFFTGGRRCHIVLFVLI